MEKGKIKNEKKYISILFIPNFSANVKSIKLSAVYTKFIALVIITLLVLSSLVFYTIYSSIENRKLKNKNAELSGINKKQNELIQKKDLEVSSLLEKEEEFNLKAKDFTKKYRELADKYIKGGIKPDRSGDNVTRPVGSDINDLKLLLEDINKFTGAEDELSEDLSAAENTLDKYLSTVPTLWPAAGSISSDFGNRRDPYSWESRFHTGLDIAAEYGSKIKAAADGKVVLADRINVYGRAIIIDHGHGIKTFYGHASKLLVKEGENVKKGDVIAYVGSSGRSTGAHLHFEVRLNDTPQNPLKYLGSK